MRSMVEGAHAMRLKGSARAQANAKSLRRALSLPEVLLWQALRRNTDFRFRKQHPAGPYVLDFYCAPARLAVEVDGETHNRGGAPGRDEIRDAWLAGQGVLVLRLPAKVVLTDLDSAVRQIISLARERLRDPPPPR